MNYTHYDYLDLAPGASPARIEAAYAAVLERFQYGATDAGQDLSGLVRMIHAAYEVLSSPESPPQLRRAARARSRGRRRRTQVDARRAAGRSARGACRTCPQPLRDVFAALAA